MWTGMRLARRIVAVWLSGILLSVAVSAAEDDPHRPVVGAGEAVEIMTGAGVPHGADAIVMVEHTTRDGEYVVTVSVLKPLGDLTDPAHNEIWESPLITIDRP